VKAEQRKQRRQDRVDLRAREFAAFEAEKAAWKQREAAFYAHRAARSAEIAKDDDAIAEIADRIRQLKNTFGTQQEFEDDDGGLAGWGAADWDDAEWDGAGGAAVDDAAPADQEMADAGAEGVKASSAACPAAEEGGLTVALPNLTIKE
jgi:hypothetical protein